eukprot:scaffold36200_cov63-Phaeocystis_antarctica.AAC.1
MPSSSRTQALGELLYVKVQVHRRQLSRPPYSSPCTDNAARIAPQESDPELATKVTGMLFDMPQDDIVTILCSNDK